MPILKTKNENFFKIWSPEMAYVLGFFTADGNMIKNRRGAHFIAIEITDRDILERIKETIGSNHKIGMRKRKFPEKDSYRIQIGSKDMFNDLMRLGITPNKSKTIDLPIVPDKYFSDFVRGYFDGDGCISYGIYDRKDRMSKNYLFGSRFSSGSKIFVENLLKRLKSIGKIGGGFIYKKKGGWDIVLSTNDTKKLFEFMYGNTNNSLFLDRKYDKFCKGLKLLENHIL